MNIEQLSDCFRALPEEELRFLNDKKTSVSYLKGETIFKQGAFATHVMFVNTGLALVYLQIDNSKQINIRIAHKGDYIALSSIFNKSVYQYSAIAIADSTFCMINKEALKAIIMRNTDFALNILTRNNENESQYLNIIKNIGYKHMRGKIASTLVYLASDNFKHDNIFKFLSRQQIADFASVTMESTVKFLKEFERDGIIALENRDIFIKDMKTLKKVSDIG